MYVHQDQSQWIKLLAKFDQSSSKVVSRFERSWSVVGANFEQSWSEVGANFERSYIAKFASKWKHIFRAYRMLYSGASL